MLLGPFPPQLREHVQRTGAPVPWPDRPIARGVILRSGSGFCCVLDEDGAMWIYDASADEMIAECPDGPEKLLQIRWAARQWPELSEWLPERPAASLDCPKCLGEGYPLSPVSQRPCARCLGLGWLAQADAEPPVAGDASEDSRRSSSRNFPRR
jgi:hypothetical protein